MKKHWLCRLGFHKYRVPASEFERMDERNYIRYCDRLGCDIIYELVPF